MTTDTAALHHTDSHQSGEAVSRLLVTWQHPIDRGYAAVGLLTCSERGYTFVYLRGEPRPRQDFGRFWVSRIWTTLTPRRIFSQSLTSGCSARRGQTDRACSRPSRWGTTRGRWSSLRDPAGTGTATLLSCFPSPSIVGGTASVTFLVHGIQHQDSAHLRIDSLKRGDELALLAEPDNLADPMALLVTSDGQPLGWVPHPLLDFVHVLAAPRGCAAGDGRARQRPTIRKQPAPSGQTRRSCPFRL